MGGFRRIGTTVMPVVIGIAALAGIRPALAAADFTIQAGAAHPTVPGSGYEYTRYFPSTLEVHRGQTVTWNILGSGNNATGFHTVSFLPDGQERPALLREDEIPGTYAVPEAWSLPAGGCGQQGQDPCVLTDTQTFISSGVPPYNPGLAFSATVDLAEGAYTYICTVHAAMQGTIEVVDEGTSLPTQAEIDQLITSEIAADTAAADAVVEESSVPTFDVVDGQKVWRVLLGDSTPDDHVSMNQYLPGSLQIEQGDAVRYVFDDDIVNEIHTVSFPEQVSGGFSPLPHGTAGFGFQVRCELDDPAGGAPALPGLFIPGAMPCPGQYELGVAPWMTSQTRALQDAVVSPLTVHDSGILVPQGAPPQFRNIPGATSSTMPVGFQAAFPAPGTFVYECNVHTEPMTGSITVT